MHEDSFKHQTCRYLVGDKLRHDTMGLRYKDDYDDYPKRQTQIHTTSGSKHYVY
jgi:hypothetical protein